ncbi:MAG TPA: CHASE2 domain-containing protein [Bryobacteraceae bacterium]|nr:CHASE2 domain-containing protein [Bryobacteraceae bacterium]
MRKLWQNNRKLGYFPIALACFLVATVAGWTAIATRIDNYVYDWIWQLTPPAPHTPQSLIVAIDGPTYKAMGGVGSYRSMVATALEQLQAAQPAVVAVDILLTDPADPAQNVRLATAMCATPNLVLIADLDNGQWDDPLPQFQECADAVGHDTSDEDSLDGVTRVLPLEKRTARERHWALSLEAFRLQQKVPIIESPEDLQVGKEIIPARFMASGKGFRPLRVIFGGDIPQISLLDLVTNPGSSERAKGKVVFIGVTDLSGARDRVRTPLDEMPGVEVHAYAYETLAANRFLVDAPTLLAPSICLAIALLTALIFAFNSGWLAYLPSLVLLAAVHAAPVLFFRQGIVFPYFGPLSTVWLGLVGAAAYQLLFVRGQLQQSEAERTRYRQAFQWVTHEMRSPLTAIQGSSELMGRYNLSEEKRTQLAEMINSESKRLARMIQTFLDVERLSEGHIGLKKEPFAAEEVIETCVGRVRAQAERKEIQVHVADHLKGELNGDRELMEYAVYNLLTNAVKYSPAQTEITVLSEARGGELRISVKDQGIGVDSKELKSIFQKFYRTKRAEASGETGSGIGLSIVEQIVKVHGGTMEVTSEVGKGSCFTIVLPAL